MVGQIPPAGRCCPAGCAAAGIARRHAVCADLSLVSAFVLSTKQL